MTLKVVIETPEAVNRKQPLLTATTTPTDSPTEEKKNVAKRNVNGNGVNSNGHGCSKIGEAVGGTAAVCCCCPCAVMHLLILAVYRVPTGLCKRAWRKKKKLQKRRLLKKKIRNSSSLDPQPNLPLGPRPIGLGLGLIQTDEEDEDDDDDEDDDETSDGDGVMESDNLEMEMWEQFYRGFWRSPSQKED